MILYTDSMVAYWNFQSGSAAPSMGAAAGATSTGAGYTVGESVAGKSAEFSDGRLSFSEPVIPPATDGFTLSFWIRPQQHSSNGYVLGNARSTSYKGLLLLFRPTNQLQFAFGKGTSGSWSFSLNTELSVNEWHHITASYSSANNLARIWVNGRLASQAIPLNMPANVSDNLSIGKRHNNSLPFTGAIAALGIWRGGDYTEEQDARRLMIGKHVYLL